MAGAGVVYLMYHELEAPGRPLCQAEPGYRHYVVSHDSFRNQLGWLRSNCVRGLNVTQSLKGKAANGTGVVFTFDDGCESDLLLAAPLLRDFGFSATFYVVVGFVGKPGYLAPAQLRQLANQEFEIGCHSMSHSNLRAVSCQQLQVEIVEAKARLEELLGRAVRHFSCPHGGWSRAVAALAEEAGYESVATSRAGVNSPAAPPFRLSRVPVFRGTPMEEFSRLARGRGLAWRALRGWVLDSAKLILGDSFYEKSRAALLRAGGQK